MRRSALALLAAAVVLAAGCRADTTGLDTLSVPELAELLAEAPSTLVCDVNGADTRQKHGVIPGARLLSSYRSYDPVRELPADKSERLVFYCHSEWCGAAVEAARKAEAAGYTAVAVLPAGIVGWAEAGQPVEHPSPGGAEAP